MSETKGLDRVPERLQGLVTDDMRVEYAAIADMPRRFMGASASDLRTLDLGTRQTRAVVLPALTPEKSDTAIGLILPHQQRWTDAHAIRARVMQRLIAPEHDVFVLPNNSIRNSNYRFAPQAFARTKSGDMRPLASLDVATLELLAHIRGTGKIALTGYSLGARVVLEIAQDHLLQKIEPVGFNADEAPSKLDRTAEELQRDFMKSGGFGAQLAAIADSGLTSLQETYTRPRLAADYALFGAAALLNSQNGAIHAAMADTAFHSPEKFVDYGADVPRKIGYVAGSRLFEVDAEAQKILGHPGVRLTEYNGEGTHEHATGDNPVIHALMVKDGLQSVLGK